MRRTIALITAVCVLMIEAAAQVTWQRAYGGYGISEGHGVRETLDHGFIVVGSTGSFGNGSSDVYLLKLDSLGERQWSRVLGGTSIDQGWAVRKLDDGGYVIAGYTDAGAGRGFDGFVVRLDEFGEPQWQHNYGTESWDFLYDIEVLEDGFVAVGGTYRGGASGEQAWVVKLDGSGSLIWENVLGNDDGTEARSVIHASDDSLVVAGSWGLPDGSRDAFVAKYDLAGNVLWTSQVSEEGDNGCYSVVETADGGYALGGFSTQPTRRVMMLAKVNAAGTFQWINHIDGGTGMWEGRAIREDYGGGLVLSGITTSYGAGEEDFYMARTDAFGNWQSGPNFGTAYGDQCWGMDMVTDGGYVMVGATPGAGINVSSVYVVKNAGDVISNPLVVELDPLNVQETPASSTLILSPNPATPGSIVRLEPSLALKKGWHAELFDVLGKSVSTFQDEGRNTMAFKVPDLAAGNYTVRVLVANSEILSARFVVQAK